MSDIQVIADRQWHWVEKHKWHNKTPLEYLALIGSEVGEAVNECRGAEPTPELADELADVLLRTLDFMRVQGIDINTAIEKKMTMNDIKGTKGRLK